jgi:hypothetical protein
MRFTFLRRDRRTYERDEVNEALGISLSALVGPKKRTTHSRKRHSKQTY